MSNIQDHIKKTARIYRQCSIKITSFSITEIETPHVSIWKAEQKNSAATMASLANSLPILPRPTIILVKEILSGLAVSLATSIPQFADKKWDKQNTLYKDSHFFRNKLLNTIWISSEDISYSENKQPNKEFDTLAHELGHLLLNDGHIDESWPIIDRESKQEEKTNPNIFIPKTHQDFNHSRFEYNLMVSGQNPQYQTGFLNKYGQCKKIKDHSSLVYQL